MLEELSDENFKCSVEPCPFLGGECDTLENAVKKAIELFRDPGEWNEYHPVNRNCQHFATFVATIGDFAGLYGISGAMHTTLV